MKKGVLTILGLLAMMLMALIFINKPEVALADYGAIKNRLHNYCGGASICALPWVSMPGSSYYDETITVQHDQRDVVVVIRGAGYANKKGYYKVQSADLRPEGGGGVSLYRLSNITLYRGNLNGGTGMSDQGSQISAMLHVGNKSGWQSFRLHSCLQYTYSNNGGYYGGTSYCDTSTHNVFIKRLPPPWNITSDTQLKVNNGAFSASDKTAAPGDMLTWKHALQNVGPGNMNNQIGINVDVQEDRVNKSHYHGYYNVRWRGNNGAWYNTGHLTQRVKASDAGKLLCQRIAWNPLSSSNSGWGVSKEVCANIPYNYQLRPTITTPSDTVQEGEKVIPNIIATIANAGPTISKPTNYAVVRFVARGAVIPADTGEGVVVPHNPAVPGNLIDDWACETARQIGQRYGSSIDSASCSGKELTKHSGPQFNVGTKQLDGFPKSDDVGSLQLKAGDQLCYATTVSTYSQSVGTDTFRYAVKCAKIAKRPKVQIWGGDVRSANQVITSRTEVLEGGVSRVYGSWAEYGIVANRGVRSASGAGLSSGDAGRTNADVTRLTFANAGVSMPGNFTNEAFNGAVRVPPVFSVNSGVLSGVKSVASLQGNYTATNLRLDGGEVAAGRRILIQASGTITITGDIRYTAAQLSDTKDIPQLVIVAKNIIIEPQVERVDAWLMSPAGGSISTCGAGVSQQPAKDIDVAACSKQLRINGPVHADKLYLRRTYGGEGKAPIHFGTPAEILNLRPDAYLWGHGSSFTTGAIRTMHVRELPPRL